MNKFLLLPTLLLLSSQASPAQQLVGIDWDTGDMYTIDNNTGAASYLSSTGIQYAGALETAPNGTMYMLDYGDNTNLYIVDPLTGHTTLVGPTGLSWITEGALAINPYGSNAYGCSENGNLFEINLGTGAATIIGSMSGIDDINGLEMRNDGMLFGIDGSTNKSYVIDPYTAVATELADVTPEIGSGGGLATMGTTTFMATSGRSVSGSNELWTIDPYSGNDSLVGDLGISGTGITGIAVMNDAPQTGDLIGVKAYTGDIFSIDKTTGMTSYLSYTGIPGVSGIEQAPDGTLYMFTSGFEPALYRVNVSTGDSTRIGDLGIGFVFDGGITFSNDGSTAYATNQGSFTDASLFSLNLATGAGTVIGSMGAHDVNGLEMRGDGMLIGIDRLTNSLVEIDPATGATSHIALLSPALGAIGGMTSIGNIFYYNTGFQSTISGSNELWTVDPYTGIDSLVGYLTGITGGGLSGISAISHDVPDDMVLNATGTPGGVMTFEVIGCTPDSFVAYFSARGTGWRGVYNPKTHNWVTLGLGFSNFHTSAIVYTGNSDICTHYAYVPANAAGSFFAQALDVSTDATSNVIGL